MIQIGVDQRSFPQYLYKYRADNDFTEKMIIENELWFANPLLFNDPYDCNTPITSKTTLPEIKNWLQKIGIYFEHIDDLAVKLQTNPNLIQHKTEEAMSKSGVCCFSSMYDNILQWSHYSDYHKGVCLKFDITEDADTFITPIIVSYRKIMQHYNHLVHSERIIEYLIQPKYFEWSYESEIRVVKTEIGLKANGGKRAFKFKDSALKEIIFGSKASDVTIEKYKKLCKDNKKVHVSFSKMEIGQGVNYELVRTNL